MVDKLDTQVEIFISGRNLPNKDTFSKSDPFCVVDIFDFKTNDFVTIGRSEYIMNDLNPDFQQQFVVDYFFEENQTLRVSFYDKDSKKEALKHHDFLGYVECSLGELVASRNQTKAIQLRNKKGKPIKKAGAILRCEEVSSSKDIFICHLRGTKLDKMDFLGKSDPYIEMFRLREDNTWVNVHTTEVKKNTLNPVWDEMRIPMVLLCNGDEFRPLKFEVYDWDRNSDPDLIGICETSVARMKDKEEMVLINPEKQAKKKKYKNSGTLQVDLAVIERRFSFLDYIAGGCNVNIMVAVDFTGSNGDPRDPKSLHYCYGNDPNQYEQAIRIIGGIVGDYDTDQEFPVWGFGGRINGSVSHCFALSLDEEHPTVKGVDGILQVYKQAFRHVALSGPTLFAQIINTAVALSTDPQTADHQHYSILLILTDGVINDMDATKRAIINACNYPLSIIIVGIGNADFGQMEELDGDDGVLQVDGDRASRDIVQFVSMNDFAQVNVAHLAKETLAEVPGQFLSYMKKHRIQPNEHKMGDAADAKYDDEFEDGSSEEEEDLPAYGVVSQPPPPAVVSQPPLPQGWIIQDDGQGTVWYFNTITQQTQWDRPQ